MLTLSNLKTRRAANLRLRLRQFVGRVCFVTTLSALSAMGIGCMVGPNYKRPAVEQPLYFKSQAASGEAPLMEREWWQLYRDPDPTRSAHRERPGVEPDSPTGGRPRR